MSSRTVNLETCDQEPIHLIGAVQPHGALIAVNKDSLIIEYASVNTASFVGAPPDEILGKELSILIGAENAHALPTSPLVPSLPKLLKPWFFTFQALDGTTIKAECLPHQSNGLIILEFIHPETAPAPVWEDELLRRGILSELLKPSALGELTEASAKIIRDVTGFDRVMIYKFAEDKHGEVIAESTNRSDSFLGLHYPASDIPDPARRHFTRNLMRSIPDIGANPVPIIGRSGGVADASSATPLDLTYSKLRAVAPVHIQYLENMGVGASLSISLVTNNELWGLIACHHYGPRLVTSSRLRFAELMGGTTSALLQSIENTNQLRKSIDAEKIAYRIEKIARSGRKLRNLIEDHADELMALIDAQGLVCSLGGDLIKMGAVPAKHLDLGHLSDVLDDGISMTSHLSSLVAMNEDQKQVAAGAAFLNLSDDGTDFLVFLRSNFAQTIRWAGKPEKRTITGDDGTTRLSPRGSFALWQEERKGQSKPFDALDHDALRIIRRALFALNSLENEKAARAAQKIAEDEENRLRHAMLEAARASSMGELASAISHELSQPLSAVSNYVNACRQEFENSGIKIPERAEELINDAVAETARAGDLVRRVRNFIARGDLNLDYIDLNDAVKQGVELSLVSCELPRLQVALEFDYDIPKLLADPVQIGQVVLNLARNSVSAMEEMETQVLTVTVARSNDKVQVQVQDTGIGILEAQRESLFEPFHASTTNGMGIGLTLCRSIIEAHEGRIWTDVSECGAKFVFELPIRCEQDA